MATPAPAETVTLRNQRSTMLPPMHLGHAEVCANHGTCLCHRMKVGVSAKRPKGGRRVVTAQARQLPATLTLAARGTEGDTITGLPLAVLHAFEVKAALKAGTIKAERVPGKVDQTAPTAKPPTPPPTATPAPTTAADAAPKEAH